MMALRKVVDKLNDKYDTDYYDYFCSDCAELLPKNKVRYWPNFCLSFLQKEPAFDNLYIIRVDDYNNKYKETQSLENCEYLKVSEYLQIGDAEDIMVDIISDAE